MEEHEGSGDSEDGFMPILFSDGLPKNFADNNDLQALAALIAEGEGDANDEGGDNCEVDRKEEEISSKIKNVKKRRKGGKITREKRIVSGNKTPYDREGPGKPSKDDERAKLKKATTNADVAEATLFLNMWKP